MNKGLFVSSSFPGRKLSILVVGAVVARVVTAVI